MRIADSPELSMAPAQPPTKWAALVTYTIPIHPHGGRWVPGDEDVTSALALHVWGVPAKRLGLLVLVSLPLQAMTSY